ncbi:hypothetical protein BJ170DRAFT_703852 [Xylariales sp. AK1849]|nr:hypothetical protein BJ170DRAFT_703852 [Xylariales sp. AK1849]
MFLLHKKALIIGATSGIGEVLAVKLAASGTSYYTTASVVDILKLSSIPSFAPLIVNDHPDLDCIILDSDIQRAFDFSKPETVDLDTRGDELTTNYTSFILLRRRHTSCSSVLHGLVPGMTRTPGYNASEAALHSWITTLRQQLQEAGNKIRVVEVFPPAPDVQNNGEIGMPLQQFIDLTCAELEKGDDHFAIGHAQQWLDKGFGWLAQIFGQASTTQTRR